MFREKFSNRKKFQNQKNNIKNLMSETQLHKHFWRRKCVRRAIFRIRYFLEIFLGTSY